MKINLILMMVCIILFVSCSNKILFTQDIRKRLEAQKIDIKKIQFYNSKRFVIKRKLNVEELNVASGKIKTKGGIYYEQIIINKGTSAICDSLNEYNLYISFDSWKNFCFTRYYNDLFNQDYKLIVKSPYLKPKEIIYNNKTYRYLGKSDKVYLKINKSNLNNLQIEKKVLPGVKVN